jgi:hypothetical protein
MNLKWVFLRAETKGMTGWGQPGPTLAAVKGRHDRCEVLTVLSCGCDLLRSFSTKR